MTEAQEKIIQTI